MASAFVNSRAPLPTLRQYFSGTTYQEVSAHYRPYSPPSTASSASYHKSPESVTSDLPPFAYSCPSVTGSPSRVRPLPTPPTSPSPSRSPRPLPTPPQSPTKLSKRFRTHPLPTPPTSPFRSPPSRRVRSALPKPPARTPATTPAVPASAVDVAPTPLPTHRPSIRLDIPSSATEFIKFTTPLSPIAFNIPGPRDCDLRKRREEELSRRITDLGFVESPHQRRVCEDDASSVFGSCDAFHARKHPFSSLASDSDSGHDVVLLIDDETDSDSDSDSTLGFPLRSESRAEMIRLFSDSDDGHGTEESFESSREDAMELDSSAYAWRPSIEVRVEVEVVTKEAVARTKRRFSRKWVRERQGKRVTECDFSEIISELRKLR